MIVVELGLAPTGAEPEVTQAAEALRRGEIVAYATETVFGLACDARDPNACTRLCELKGREDAHTLPVQVAEAAPPYWPWELHRGAKALLDRFAPGPITVVIPSPDGLGPQTVGADGTVAIRIPDHAVARAVLRAFRGPLACPSANPTGSAPAMTASDVVRYFPNGIAAVLAGGEAPSGTASTIVAISNGKLRVLRHGAIGEQEVVAWFEGYCRSR